MPTLTDVDVRNAKPGEITDGDGLILVVRASRSGGKLRRAWVLRIMDGGRRRKLGLGAYPAIGLGQARQRATDARRKLAEGIDPSVTEKRRTAALEAARTLSLGQAIDDYLAKAAPMFKSDKSSAIRYRALHIHFAPLHPRDVTSITVADVAGILRRLKPQTAVRSHASHSQLCSDFAIVVLEAHTAYRFTANPCRSAKRLLRHLGWSPKSAKAATPHPALDWRQMPEFMAELARHDGVDARRLALIILTVVRAGTARQAKWRDIDLERRIWSVPVADLKDSKHRTAPFVVPLSEPAIDLIKALPRRGAFLFPNAANHPIDDQAIVHAIRVMHRCGDWKDPKTGKPIDRARI